MTTPNLVERAPVEPLWSDVESVVIPALRKAFGAAAEWGGEHGDVFVVVRGNERVTVSVECVEEPTS